MIEPAVRPSPVVAGRLRVTLSQKSSTDTTITYHTVDGSAVGTTTGGDYKPKGTAAKPLKVTIKAGKVTAALTSRFGPMPTRNRMRPSWCNSTR